MGTQENIQMENFERRLMLSFGLIIFALIMLLSGLFITLYHWAMVKEHDNLTFTISNLAKNTIRKMDDPFSESSKQLIQEMELDNPEVIYIMILNGQGKIMAHSEPKMQGEKLAEDKMVIVRQVFKENKQITEEIYFEEQFIRDINIPIKIAGETAPHVLKVGVSKGEFVKNLRDSFWFVVFLAIGTTALAMIYVHFLSAKLSAPVKNMAQKLQGILDYAPMMIIIKDRDGNFSDLSKNCYDLLPKGTKIDDTMSLFSMISEDQMEKLRKDESAVFKGEKVISTREYTIHDPENDRSIIMTTFPVIQNTRNEVTHLCHISVDITERIHLREQFMQAQKMESLGHLAGGISHDFNNLISVIMGYTSLLLTDESLSDETLGDINNIKDASMRATSLVRKLMAFSRRDSIRPQKTDINLLIKDTENMFSRLIPENIHLKMDLVSYPLYVLLDPAHFEQALVNLINNSVDAIGKELDGDIIIGTVVVDFNSRNVPSPEMQAGKYVEVSVIDSGCGMDKTLQNKIFEPFFTTKEVDKGTGLGLSMVYGLVKQLQGDIQVESESGQGATFKIYLPLEPESDIESEDKQKFSEEKHNKEAHGNKTILVAEDEVFVRELVARTLKKFSYKVIPAENGQQAVDMALTNNVDLLLTDIIMPFKNGTDAYLEIKESKPELPCIYMSGYTADLLESTGEDPENIHFLQKPLNLDKLLTMVQEVIKQAETGEKKTKKKKK